MTDYVQMGEYYHSEEYGMVRTVCRAKNYDGPSYPNHSYIIYVNILDGGYAGDPISMPEVTFQSVFKHV